MKTQEAPEAIEYNVTLPVKPNMRQQVELFIDHLPEDLTGKTVIVDASNAKDITSSFADELIRQIISVRNAPELVLLSSPEILKTYTVFCAERRGFSKRISFRDTK